MGLNVNRISNRISEMLQLALDSQLLLSFIVAPSCVAHLQKTTMVCLHKVMLLAEGK